jgi:hypothetical protein
MIYLFYNNLNEEAELYRNDLAHIHLNNDKNFGIYDRTKFEIKRLYDSGLSITYALTQIS